LNTQRCFTRPSHCVLHCVGHCTFYDMVQSRYAILSRGIPWNIPLASYIFLVCTLVCMSYLSLVFSWYAHLPKGLCENREIDSWNFPLYTTQKRCKTSTGFTKISLKKKKYAMGVISLTSSACILVRT